MASTGVAVEVGADQHRVAQQHQGGRGLLGVGYAGGGRDLGHSLVIDSHWGEVADAALSFIGTHVA